MPKFPTPGRCAHCLREEIEITADHVFPRSWYPDTTPTDIEKWQMPSCGPCNADLGRMEEDLLLVLALCVDPNADGSSGVAAGVIRSLKPELAKDERDRRAREARLNRLNVMIAAASKVELRPEAIFPGLGERWNRGEGAGIPLLLSETSLKRLAEKIIRGIYYIDNGAFITPPYRIDVYVLSDPGSRWIRRTLRRYGKEFARGPGIAVRRATTGEDPMIGMFEVEIWGQFKIYGAVDDETRQPEDAPGVCLTEPLTGRTKYHDWWSSRNVCD